MLKLSDNPPILAPWAKCIADLHGRWWVAHTRSRFAKAFARDLLRNHTGYFLPMVQRVIVSGGRKRRSMMPLFGSYVFFCGLEADRYNAMTTNRLCSVIEVSDQEQLIVELTALHLALRGQAELDPCPFVAQGRRCRVTVGPFAGTEGVVVQRMSVTRLVLGVSILGQGASLEIDADLLEPID